MRGDSIQIDLSPIYFSDAVRYDYVFGSKPKTLSQNHLESMINEIYYILNGITSYPAKNQVMFGKVILFSQQVSIQPNSSIAIKHYPDRYMCRKIDFNVKSGDKYISVKELPDGMIDIKKKATGITEIVNNSNVTVEGTISMMIPIGEI